MNIIECGGFGVMLRVNRVSGPAYDGGTGDGWAIFISTSITDEIGNQYSNGGVLTATFQVPGTKRGVELVIILPRRMCSTYLTLTTGSHSQAWRSLIIRYPFLFLMA